jgi:hypothetical protein
METEYINIFLAAETDRDCGDKSARRGPAVAAICGERDTCPPVRRGMYTQTTKGCAVERVKKSKIKRKSMCMERDRIDNAFFILLVVSLSHSLGPGSKESESRIRPYPAFLGCGQRVPG